VSQSIVTIKFASGNLQYVRDAINSVQIVHYKSIDLKRILDDSTPPQSVFEQNRSAEVLIVYRNDERTAKREDIVRITLHRKSLFFSWFLSEALTSQSKVEL
jgi:hypothetical protein